MFQNLSIHDRLELTINEVRYQLDKCLLYFISRKDFNL
jgi:hypothetical protein